MGIVVSKQLVGEKYLTSFAVLQMLHNIPCLAVQVSKQMRLVKLWLPT